jgi:hypothetical protein
MLKDPAGGGAPSKRGFDKIASGTYGEPGFGNDSDEFGEGAMSSTRTLLRPGKNAYLVRIDGRRGVRFCVGGPNEGEHHSFSDLPTAVGWFETVERGDERPRRP